MKRFLQMVLLFCLMVPFFIPAPVSAQYNKAISADPVGLAFGIFNATYENKVGKSNSFTLFGSYFTFSGGDWVAFGFGGSYRWYLNVGDGNKALKGLSVGPYASLGFWQWKGSSIFNDYSGGTSVALGGEIAYKWILNGFVIEPIFRLAFNLMKITGLTYQAYGLGVNLGYAWK